MASLRGNGRRSSEVLPAPVLFRSSLSTILDRGGFDLDIALEFLGERRAGDDHLLAYALIRSMFPRAVDREGVLAAVERLAVVVLAVPDDGVLAGRARGAGDREDHFGLVDELPG